MSVIQDIDVVGLFMMKELPWMPSVHNTIECQKTIERAWALSRSNRAAFLLSAKLSDVYFFHNDVHARYERCQRLVGWVVDRVPTLLVLTPGNCAHTTRRS